MLCCAVVVVVVFAGMTLVPTVVLCGDCVLLVRLCPVAVVVYLLVSYCMAVVMLCGGVVFASYLFLRSTRLQNGVTDVE